MRWRGRAGSENVEDRRSMRGPVMVGGGGLIGVILVVVFTLLSGGDLGQALQQGVQQAQRQAAAQAAAQSGTPINPEDDEQAQFASVVLRLTEDVWNEVLPQQIGRQYQEPTLVLFRDGVTSACGMASAAVGPFYCPADNNVYLDLSFFEELQTKFGAPGDFACAYVIAHEVGHHIQNLLGLSGRVQQMQSRLSEVDGNELSVRLELQAEFLAGVWAHYAKTSLDVLEEGDIGEAIGAAQAIGDDTLQRKATGRVMPESFTHGTSEQRIRWFSEGLKSGDVSRMDSLFELDYTQL